MNVYFLTSNFLLRRKQNAQAPINEPIPTRATTPSTITLSPTITQMIDNCNFSSFK